MPSSEKEDELQTLLISETFRITCLAIISRFISGREDVVQVYHDTRAGLLRQNVEKVDDMRAFVAQAMINQAKLFFKNKIRNEESSATGFSNGSAADSLFPHIEHQEIRDAVKKHRDNIDFAIFELNAQEYKDVEIAAMLGMKHGTVSKRLSTLRRWIKKYVDEQ